jgi:hypothetical protein
VRGDYGTGKTFFARWVQYRALHKDFAVAEVQISETETPLYHLETLYRRAVESLRTREWEEGAFRALIDRWFYDLEEEVLARPGFPANDAAAVAKAVGELLEQRLTKVSAQEPMFAQVLRAVHAARMGGDAATSDGLLAWLMGQPNVGAASGRQARRQGGRSATDLSEEAGGRGARPRGRARGVRSASARRPECVVFGDEPRGAGRRGDRAVAGRRRARSRSGGGDLIQVGKPMEFQMCDHRASSAQIHPMEQAPC